MVEEMTLENVPWESDEWEDSESDEAIAEAEDSAEDIGESRRRRRRRSRYAPGRGVRGIVMRGPDGRARNLPFPTKLATADETNRGLARQEIGRRELEARLDRLEARFRTQQTKDSSAAGFVTLLIGGGLAASGVVEANRKPAGSRLEEWSKLKTTELGAVASVTQLATSGAKLVINGRYHRSGIGIAADVFAGAQIAAFAFARMYKRVDYKPEPDRATALRNIANYEIGDQIVTDDLGQTFRVEENAAKVRTLRLIR
jgi:hypothetical protein